MEEHEIPQSSVNTHEYFPARQNQEQLLCMTTRNHKSKQTERNEKQTQKLKFKSKWTQGGELLKSTNEIQNSKVNNQLCTR